MLVYSHHLLRGDNGFNHPTRFILIIEKIRVHNGKYTVHMTIYEERCVVLYVHASGSVADR